MRYVRENRRRSYWLALFFFVLALLSKPMPVTLPVVMLLLDYWPLARFAGPKLKIADGQPTAFQLPFSVLWEKWPFCLMSRRVVRHHVFGTT